MRRHLGAALLGLSCSTQALSDEIVVAAAVSLREPLTEIVALYEAGHPEDRIVVALGASSFLAAQVRAGAPIEVLLSADSRIVDELERDGFIAPGDRFDVAGNRLVVVTRRGIGFDPETAHDLTRAEFRRIAVADLAVPVGRYAREWLASEGLIEVLMPRLVRTDHARATLAAVDLGHADAAIVYATDARVARSARRAFVVPEERQPRIVYTAARLRESSRLALDFFAFLRGRDAREALATAGFAATPRRAAAEHSKPPLHPGAQP